MRQIEECFYLEWYEEHYDLIDQLWQQWLDDRARIYRQFTIRDRVLAVDVCPF